MNLDNFIDRFISNFIVYFSHTIVIFLWYYIFHSFENYINLLIFYFPFGIIILAFLFFGNKIFFGTLLSYFTFYCVLKNYNLDLPFNNFFALSSSQLVCVPLTLFALQKFKITIGAGKNYKIDKTNIFHVLKLTFYSVIMLGTIIFFSSLFFYNQTDLFTFTTGSLLGGGILIILMKILVNMPNLMTSLVKNN